MEESGAQGGVLPPVLPQNGVQVGRLEQMFLGRFEHTIDDKGRLTIPSHFRAALAAGVVITRGIDGCLFIFPRARWEELAAKFEQMPAITQEDTRSLERFFFTEAIDCVPDKQGRVLIPTYLREYAHLQDQAIVAGVRQRVEVWNPAAFEQDSARLEKNVGTIAAAVSQQRVL